MKKNYVRDLCIIGLMWFLLGFICGLMDTVTERDGYKKEHGGCVYKSFIVYLSPGYLLSCELFRERFAREGLL